MALIGKPSTAHRYDKTGTCVYCGTYRNIVEKFIHVCTKERELEEDGIWLGKDVRGGVTSQTT